MKTSEKPLVIRMLGIACCLSVLLSYRPVTQADEPTLNVAPQQASPIQHDADDRVMEPVELKSAPVIQRTGPIFRTASFLQKRSVLVPPAPVVNDELVDVQELTVVEELPERSVVVPKPSQPQPTLLDDNWSMTITPGKRSSKEVNPKEYNKIYQKIPFRRSEYLANPSYRHEATMEIMFGELRPTVVHKTNPGERIYNPKPQLYPDNQFLSNDYWRYHPPALRYFNRYLPMHY